MRKIISIRKITVDTPVEEAKVIPNNLYSHPYPKFPMPTHPLATKKGKVSISRHNASIKLGHWLCKNERVSHLDGDSRNIDPENLEVRIKVGQNTMICDYCGKEFCVDYICQSERSKHHYCSLPCAYKGRRKLTDISPEELSRLVWKQPVSHLAAEFDISSTTIFNRCREYGVSNPPHNYWQKIYAGKLHDEALEECGYRDIGSEFVELEKIDW